MAQTRQLAAIMFTDIQGYSALMQEDEVLAVNMRARHREIFAPTTEKHNGKILQYYGDGTLSIFNSAVEAINAGIDLQLQFREDPNIPVRIGIHLGDILYDEEDIIGDGVNVASRIESLGVPGSVLISDKINDEIANKSAFQTESLGKFALKNITAPREVFAIKHPGLTMPTDAEILMKPEKFKLTMRLLLKIVLLVAFALVLAFLVSWFVGDILKL